MNWMLSKFCDRYTIQIEQKQNYFVRFLRYKEDTLDFVHGETTVSVIQWVPLTGFQPTEYGSHKLHNPYRWGT